MSAIPPTSSQVSMATSSNGSQPDNNAISQTITITPTQQLSEAAKEHIKSLIQTNAAIAATSAVLKTICEDVEQKVASFQHENMQLHSSTQDFSPLSALINAEREVYTAISAQQKEPEAASKDFEKLMAKGEPALRRATEELVAAEKDFVAVMEKMQEKTANFKLMQQTALEVIKSTPKDNSKKTENTN